MDAKRGAKVRTGIGMALVFTLAGFAMHGILSATAGEKSQATPEILAEGKALYEKKCAVCHGTDGRGDGSAAYLLYPKPRDFTSGQFKIRSTLTLPTDQDLFNIITNGIAGTSMPSWAALTEQDRWAVVAYVKSLSPVFRERTPGEPVAIPKAPPRSPGLLALGKKFYKEAGCFDCHGVSGKGDGPSAATLKDEWGYPIVPYDFTVPGRMKGGSTVQDVYRTLQVGIGGTPMPAYSDSLTPEETWALAYYTLSLAKAPLTEPAPSQPGTVVSKFIRGQIPLDPSGPTWAKLPLARVHLEPLWIRKQIIEEVRVKSVHNGQQIAFLVEWDDPIVNQDVLRSQDFRDAVAIQFPAMSAELHGAGHPEPSFTMGEEHGPVNIWHWKADWEADLKRYRDLQDRYAGMAADLYPFNQTAPPGSSVTAQVKAPTASHDSTFLTGWGAGNLLSTPNRRSSVEDLNALGFGTLTSQPTEDQNVQGRGIWKGGKWRVVIVREMRSKGDRDAQFIPGQSLPVAFAVWDGAQGDRDGQKAVSVWQQLKVENVR